jgi:hypothetical protein
MTTVTLSNDQTALLAKMDSIADELVQVEAVSSKRDTVLFYITELKNDGAKRKDIIETLMGVLNISSANAAYYVDRVAKAA